MPLTHAAGPEQAVAKHGAPADRLTPAWAKPYFLVCLALQIAYLAGMVATILHQRALVQTGGKPFCNDFIAFWSGARTALGGHPGGAYNDIARAAMEHENAWMGNDPHTRYGYFYPPPFLLLTLPLGLIGYVPAMATFLAAGYAVLIAGIRRIVRPMSAWGPLILSPAMLVNTIIGQNGAFTAACFAGSMLLLDKRPLFGGACLGLLSVKPHLAVTAPLALLAARRWRALAGFAGAVALLCLAATAAFGMSIWLQFLPQAAVARGVVENFPDNWTKMQSMFTAVRLWHGTIEAAYAVQIPLALCSLVLLLLIARCRPGAGLEVAALVPAGMLCTPYIFDYDLTCPLVSMAYFWAESGRTGWHPGERPVLLALYIVPLLARLSLMVAGVPLVPPLLVSLLILCWRRVNAMPVRHPGRPIRTSADAPAEVR